MPGRSAGIKVLGGSRLIGGALTFDGLVQPLRPANQVSSIELLSVTVQAYQDLTNQSANNIAIIVVDPSTGTQVLGYVLTPGEAITIDMRDAFMIKVQGTVGDGLIWLGLVQ